MRLQLTGRQAELHALASAWQRVVSDRTGPEIVVIAAEPGLGKTRLVQEFYRSLSTHCDGTGDNGYWPDELPQRDEEPTLMLADELSR